MDQSAAAYWRSRGRRTAWRHNIGWWLSSFLPKAAVLGVVFACTVLLLRRAGAMPGWEWDVFAGLLIGLALWSWREVRGRFFTAGHGLERLDVHLGLHNRLTSAEAGVGGFPGPGLADDGLRWRWGRILAPILGAVAVLIAAALIPLGHTANERLPVEPPPAWGDVAAWADQLKKSDTVQQPALERLKDQVSDLHEQPESAWYSQSSLEAGDALREQTAQSIDALRNNLQSMKSSLAAAEELGEKDSASGLGELQKQMATALKGLEMGNLPLNRELLGQLKNIDPSKIKKLDPKKLQEIQSSLRKGTAACAACIGMSGGEQGVPALTTGEQKPGGTGGGTETAPLSLNPRPEDLHTTGTQGLPEGDDDRTMPGDVIAVTRSAPQNNAVPAATGGSAGTIATAGSGGEAAWRNDLTPEERETLQRFFK